MDAFLEMQAEAWRTGKGDMESARLDQPACKVDMLPEMFKDIQQIIATYAGKASHLISNSSTNLAECWMKIWQKFDGGKQVFRGKRGIFNHRSTGSLLRFMFGPQWSPQVWELCTNKQAYTIFNYRYLERQVRYEASKKSKGQAKMKNILRHRRYARTGESKTKDAIQSYGPECIQDKLDISTEKWRDLWQKIYIEMNRFLVKNVTLSKEDAAVIEGQTRAQSEWAVNISPSP